MQDVLLLAAVAVVFAFGWFLMEKLDCFLETNRHAQELQLPSDENTLRLGFCNPTVEDSVTDALEQYSKLYPDISVRTFYGSEEELLKGFSAGEFDVILLPENADIPAILWIGEAAFAFASCFGKYLEDKFTCVCTDKIGITSATWYNKKAGRNADGNIKARPGSAFKSNPK